MVPEEIIPRAGKANPHLEHTPSGRAPGLSSTEMFPRNQLATEWLVGIFGGCCGVMIGNFRVSP